MPDTHPALETVITDHFFLVNRRFIVLSGDHCCQFNFDIHQNLVCMPLQSNLETLIQEVGHQMSLEEMDKMYRAWLDTLDMRA